MPEDPALDPVPAAALPGVPFCRRGGRFTYLGAKLQEWTGLAPADALGEASALLGCVPEAERAAVAAAWGEGACPAPFTLGARHVEELPGSEGWGLWIERRPRALDGERRLIRRLGILAGSVVHEVNNPLSGVLNYVRVAHRLAGGDPRLEEFLSGAEGEAERILTITRTLLELAPRPAGEGLRPVAPGAVLSQALLLTRTELRDAGLRYRLEPPGPELPLIRVADHELALALLALLEDSARFAPRGSEVALSSDVCDCGVDLIVEDSAPRPRAGWAEAGYEGARLADEVARRLGGRLEVQALPEGRSRVALCLAAWGS